VSGEFAWRMEEVIDTYARPLDPNRPVVCFDEAQKELRQPVRPDLPAEPAPPTLPPGAPRRGKPVRQDNEYTRCGVANLFMVVCPLLGFRHVTITQRRTAVDFAHQMKDLVDVHFPQAEKVMVVMDNLNTHTKAALYEAFAPEEAKRIADRLEFVYTPKHASWLNMAELEWSVLRRQCLDRRIGDQELLRQEIAAWEGDRNDQQVKINWCFKVADARVKLRHLYPKLPVETSATDH
jgi:transposase